MVKPKFPYSKVFIDKFQVVPGTLVRLKCESSDGSLKIVADSNGHYEILVYRIDVPDDELSF